MLLNIINPRPRGPIMPGGVFETGCSVYEEEVKHYREAGFDF